VPTAAGCLYNLFNWVNSNWKESFITGPEFFAVKYYVLPTYICAFHSNVESRIKIYSATQNRAQNMNL